MKTKYIFIIKSHSQVKKMNYKLDVSSLTPTETYSYSLIEIYSKADTPPNAPKAPTSNIQQGRTKQRNISKETKGARQN